jgi:broad specificity phosphatase PhoE
MRAGCHRKVPETPEMREVHYGDLDGKLQSSNSRYGG